MNYSHSNLLYRYWRIKYNVYIAFIFYIFVRIFVVNIKRKKVTHEELEEQYIKDKHLQLNRDININDTLIKVKDVLNDLKTNQSKFNLWFILGLLLSGVILGTQYEIWLPYLQDGYKVVKTISKG